MRIHLTAALIAALVPLAPGLAAAQGYGTDPATGARRGHVPGQGQSLPRSSRASNVTEGNVRSPIAPTLPDPGIGTEATTADYLQAARRSLAAGATGAAQQSLEMAETRSLDRSVAPSRAGEPNGDRIVSLIRDARLALGGGDTARALMLIDQALAG